LVDRLNAREAPETVFVDAIARHKDLLKITAVDKKRPAKVAIIGGMPQREPMRYRFASKGAWSPGKFGLDNFADTIGLIVSTLAPQAELVFVPLGPKSRTRGLTLMPDEREVAAALDTAAEAEADIVLIPFALQVGSGRAWGTRYEAIKRHADKRIVISTPIPKSTQELKQNKGIPLAGLDALFVGSVDVDGGYKGATLSFQEVFATYPGAVWAPGTRIPRLTGDGTWQTTYGSSYAVATAGAAIANIFLATPDKAPREIMAAVRKSAQFLDRRDPKIGVIDQRAALNELSVTVSPDTSAQAAKDVCAKNVSPPA
jgi:hypothetical protein